MILVSLVAALNILHLSLDCTTLKTDSGKLEKCRFTNDSTGRLEFSSSELDGVNHGKLVFWYPSGVLKSEDQYRHGRLVDTSMGYYETGELSGLTICDSLGDSCTWTSYLHDGQVCGGGQSKKGVSVGRSWSKYADGKWQHLTERDEIGRYHGLRATWDSLGRPIDSIVYLHDAILRSRHWFPNSSQLSTHWVNDSSDVVNHKAKPRVWEAAWYGPDGKSWGTIVNGNGVLRYFHEGKLVGTETFKNGVMVKTTHKFLDDGSLNPLYAKKKKR